MREALHRANKATKDHDDLLAMLCLLTPSLIGVRVKSASAILACIYPEQYTVVDELAARAFDNWNIKDPDITFYCDYLNECRRLRTKYGIELRALDRAFWEWGKRHPNRTEDAEANRRGADFP